MYLNNIQFTPLEIRLLRYVYRHFNEKLNARQLAKRLDANHAHINKLCASLETKKLLIKESFGNGFYYSFNYESEQALMFIEYIISLEVIFVPSRLKIIFHTLQKFNEYIELGFIFGSSVYSDSFNDVDIFLMYNKKNTAKIQELKNEILRSDFFDVPFRYVEVTSDDLVKNKDHRIFYEIFANSYLFYNASKFIEVIRWLK